MIRMENVEMCYSGGIKALERTSVEFKRGSFTVLLGPSGAGKSTLLRCLNLLNCPTSGKVFVEGIGDLPGNKKLLRRHRCRTAMIFQQHQLIPRHSALRNVLIGRIGEYGTLRSLFPLPRQEYEFALDCLDRVQLLDKALERADNLSGGQQQRVGIARALAQKPHLILADEPVASLDPATADIVLALIHRIIKEDRITAIVSMHQVGLALKYADRIIGLAEGRIVLDDAPQSVSRDKLQSLYRSSQEIGKAA
jgi:phosphonate transport system ATP-binding protein